MLAPMGSTANKHGRIIGTNVTGGHDTFPGVLGTAVAKVFGFNVARTGLNELQAKEAGFKTEISLVPGEEHATYYPGSRSILVKLIAEKSSGRLLGGQIVGQGETAKRADVLATALSFGAVIEDVANLDLAYAPPYNSAMDPLHHAANVIRNKQDGYARTLTSGELKKKLDDNEDFILLDVRSEEEWNKDHFITRQAMNIPLPQLRKRLAELPGDKEIVVHCQISVRSYQALRILDGAGFKNVRFLDGSLSAWPYDDYKK
jgi:rhodanese-related sulfurtransferase